MYLDLPWFKAVLHVSDLSFINEALKSERDFLSSTPLHQSTSLLVLTGMKTGKMAALSHG